jgi:hypothetical protein
MFNLMKRARVVAGEVNDQCARDHTCHQKQGIKSDRKASRQEPDGQHFDLKRFTLYNAASQESSWQANHQP